MGFRRFEDGLFLGTRRLLEDFRFLTGFLLDIGFLRVFTTDVPGTTGSRRDDVLLLISSDNIGSISE